MVFLVPGMLGSHHFPLLYGGVNPRVRQLPASGPPGPLTRSTVVIDLHFSEIILACATLGEVLPWEPVFLFDQV